MEGKRGGTKSEAVAVMNVSMRFLGLWKGFLGKDCVEEFGTSV